VHIFPFRMTEQHLADRRGAPWSDFWRDLKPAYDAVESTGLPPKVSVCQGRYVVSPAVPATAGSSAVEQVCPPRPGDAKS
jgi:murein L,D-transpeptidase YafK